MTKAIIFDLDGTLADLTHRLHHIQGDSKNWDAFFEACDEDELIEHIAEIYYIFIESGHKGLLIVSGRSDQVRGKTEKWLFDNFFDHAGLYMRRAGDHRPDYQVKQELLKQIRADDYEPIMAFDDRNQVVQMWRKNDIPCLQVADGDF